MTERFFFCQDVRVFVFLLGVSLQGGSFQNLSSKLNYFSLCLYLYNNLAILKIISMTEGTFHGT